METLDLGFHRKARIWLGELPDLQVAGASYIEHASKAEILVASEVQRVAVELFIPHGGRAEYGLLGAMFTPDRTGQYKVRVSIAESAGPHVDWALASKVDDVHAGLPAGYARVVLSEASVARAQGSGVLVFNWAAHGMAGSSPMFFRRIARIVLRLITQSRDIVVNADVLYALLEDRTV